MTIKKKIFIMGGISFVLFVVLALTNIWTHKAVLSSLQVRDRVSEKLASIQEFGEWKSTLVQSVSAAVQSGHVRNSTTEHFTPPAAFDLEELDLLIQSAKELVSVVGEKEQASVDTEYTFNGFRKQINDLYLSLDEEITTVLATAQMAQVLGEDSSSATALTPYVLKSLNQLTLVALNSLVSRSFTRENKAIVDKNNSFLSTQLPLIDTDDNMKTLFDELFSQIELLDTFIVESSATLFLLETRISQRNDNFNKIVERTVIDSFMTEVQADLDTANIRLENTSQRTLVIVGLFLLVVPVLIVIFGLLGLNKELIGPIRGLINAMKNVENGEFDVAAPVQTQDEIGELASAFNIMAGEIKTKVTELDQLNHILLESQKRLQLSEERLEFALTGANDGVWDWDVSNNSIHFDPRYFTMAGYEVDEFSENFAEWEKRIHPEDLDFCKTAIKQYFAKERQAFDIEFRFLRKDHTFMWLRGRGKIVARDSDGNPSRFVGTHSDITDRKKAEEELRNLRNYLANIINSMPSVLVGVNRSGDVILWNKEAERTTGLSAKDAVGCSLATALPRYSGVIDKVNNSIETRTEQIDLKRTRSENNRTLYENLTVYPLVANGVEGAVIRIDDVTREQELENRINHSSKMEVVGVLAGGVAHDFNNMLGGILGATELLKLYLPDDPKSNKLHQTILDATTRAADLTAKMLTFSRHNVQASSVVDVHEIIRETIALLENTIDRRIIIDVDLGSDLSNIVGDPSQLQNVFLNIGVNGTHAMAEGGTLFISSQKINLDVHYCDASTFDIQPGNYIEIEIRDTGAGIPLENQSKVFDPFFTTKEPGKGTGLGLAAVYGSVQQHKGTIHLYSELGQGTTIHILLPLTAADRIISNDKQEVIKGKGRILIADDEQVMRVTAQAILEELGYQVVLAEDGQQALNLFQKEKGAFDLVILDMVMPVLNGRDCFLALKQLDAKVRVILSSGFTREEEIKDMKMGGLNGFIRKPYRRAELSQVVYKGLQ